PLRPALPRSRAPRADRYAARALRALARPQRACGLLLARDAPAARALPRLAPRARARPPRPAVHTAPRPGGRTARSRARPPPGQRDLARRDPRPGSPRTSLGRDARVRMRRYVQDVAVLARKDLTLELRARDTLPAMLIFVVAALVVFHFA